MVNFKNWPQWLLLAFAFMWFGFGWKEELMVNVNVDLKCYTWSNIIKYHVKDNETNKNNVRLPSRIFCSNSSKVGSMSSHPSGGGLRLRRTFGIINYATKIPRLIQTSHFHSPTHYIHQFVDLTLTTELWQIMWWTILSMTDRESSVYNRLNA